MSKSHGLSNTPEYSTYHAMKRRCYDTKLEKYSKYGGRGIQVCSRWLDSFENFYTDMGPKPSPKHSIDRINVDGDYTPENCRWATPCQQAANKTRRGSKTGLTGIQYREKTKKYLVSISANKVNYFIGSFPSLDDAIFARKKAEETYHAPLIRPWRLATTEAHHER